MFYGSVKVYFKYFSRLRAPCLKYGMRHKVWMSWKWRDLGNIDIDYDPKNVCSCTSKKIITFVKTGSSYVYKIKVNLKW